MVFELEKNIAILERTPDLVTLWLSGLPEFWTNQNDGGESWSAYDIIGHFIHGEKTDWIPRMKIILSSANNKTFEPFDRFAQFENSKGKSLDDLLDEFRKLRRENIETLKATELTPDILARKGIHPEFGEVTLSQLLSTWVVHDLAHLAQIAKVMAKQHKNAIGPWKDYISLVN